MITFSFNRLIDYLSVSALDTNLSLSSLSLTPTLVGNHRHILIVNFSELTSVNMSRLLDTGKPERADW